MTFLSSRRSSSGPWAVRLIQRSSALSPGPREQTVTVPGATSSCMPSAIVADAVFWEYHGHKLIRLFGLRDTVSGNFDHSGD